MQKLLLLAGLMLSGVAFSQTILSEDFESGIPGTWTTSTLGTAGWTGGTAATLSSSNWTISSTNATKIVATNDDACNCDESADRITSPSMDLTSYSVVVFQADVFFNQGTYNGATEDTKIQISTDGGSTWTTLQTLSQQTDWITVSSDLSAYTTFSNVKISFLYNDGGDWLFGSAMDNFKVFVPLANNVTLNSVTLPRYSAVSTNNTLVMNVTNSGSNTVTSITADWNDGTSHSQIISVNIAPFSSANVNHTTPVNYATAAEANISVNITAMNGGSDDDPSDNTGATMINTVSQVVPKNVVFEEGTGTWCGWCVRGIVAMNYMTATYPDHFIGIAVHNGDPMVVSAYDAGANFSGFPGSNVDRVLLDQSVSQSGWEGFYNARKDLIVPAGISITPSGTGSSVVLDVSATFYTPFAAANYRLGVAIVENGVTGTGTNYDQHNYYSGGSYGAMGGFESLANPVPAADMVYDHVARALIGGYAGQTGTVPATITDGTVATYTFNYTVPSTSNRANMKAVVFLIDQTTGEIVNAEEVPIAEAGLSELNAMNFNVYPNPASDVVNVSFDATQAGDYTVRMLDLQGREVNAQTLSNLSGSQTVTLPTAGLAKGSYIVSISTGAGVHTENVVIK